MTASLSSAPLSFSRLFYYIKFRPKRTVKVHIEKGCLRFSRRGKSIFKLVTEW